MNSSIQAFLPACSLPCIEISGPISIVECMRIWFEWKGAKQEKNIASSKNDRDGHKEYAAQQQSVVRGRLSVFSRVIVEQTLRRYILVFLFPLPLQPDSH